MSDTILTNEVRIQRLENKITSLEGTVNNLVKKQREDHHQLRMSIDETVEDQEADHNVLSGLIAELQNKVRDLTNDITKANSKISQLMKKNYLEAQKKRAEFTLKKISWFLVSGYKVIPRHTLYTKLFQNETP